MISVKIVSINEHRALACTVLFRCKVPISSSYVQLSRRGCKYETAANRVLLYGIKKTEALYS